MGCLCSKGTDVNDYVAEYEEEREKEQSKCSVQLIAPCNREDIITSQCNLKTHANSLESKISSSSDVPEDKIIQRPENGHRRHSTVDSGVMQQTMSRITSMPHGVRAEQAAAGWPSWLTSVAGEAVKGWTPRSADSYEKLNKVCSNSLNLFH